MSGSTPRVLANEDYTVGWICAIPAERAAAKGMLDEIHKSLEKDVADHNTYTLGRIQDHNVVIASLPAGISGTTTAATVAKDMLRTFKSIRFGLMVGIGGGAPSAEHDIRLGDIVVSQPSENSGGVIQYDRGKALKDGFKRTGSLNAPPKLILTALADLQADHSVGDTRIPEFVSNFTQKNPKTQKGYGYPEQSKDHLFTTEYQHEAGSTSACNRCDPARLVQREARDDTDPVVHYGTIASGNQVIKDPMLRDRLQREYDVLCFEMEAAGLMLDFPCIVIRGISDYADSHKNDAWQGYAAVTAAAFAKELLVVMSPAQVKKEKAVPQLVSDPELHERINQVNESIKTEARNQKLRYEDDERIACHQAFKTSAYESFKNLNPDRVSGTCMWVLDHPQYRRWQQSSHNDLLWISADPGCGKSVLAKSLVDGELRTTSEHTVCYFFFKDNAGQISLATALCALLHQLFTHQPKLIENAMDAFEHNGNGLQHEIDEMWRILLAAAADENAHNMTCVLDALDECSGIDRRNLIQHLTQFYSRQKVKMTAKAHLKFLVTSRAYGDIEYGFGNIPPELPAIRLAGERSNTDITREITLVIQQKVSNMANTLSLDQETQYALLRKLQSTPQRTYLWLHLVMDELFQSSKQTKKAFMTTIGLLPETVEDAYENILRKLKENHRKNAEILLHIIVGARRPLRLAEMDVAFQLATDSPNAENHKDLDLDNDHLESRLRDLCGLFIFVDDDRIYLIHQTAKEFLLKKSTRCGSSDGSWKESIDEMLSNKIMMRICVQYLSFVDIESTFMRHGQEWSREWLECGTEYPFLHYSARHWPSHISSAGVVDDEMLDQITRVLYNDKHPRFESLLEALCRTTNPYLRSRCPNGIHLAILDGNYEILNRLLREPRQDLDEKNTNGQTPLMLASSQGSDKIVERLVVAGARLDPETNDGLTPLSEASLRGNNRIVQLLIDAGANINARAGCSGNPLVAACSRGHEATVNLLLSRGAEINSPDGARCSALGITARLGRLSMARMLLDKGARLNFTDCDGHTPLWEAADHEDVFSMLLEEGATIDASILSKREEIIKRRAAAGNESHIQPGAKMDVPDEKECSPLYTAVRTRNIGAVKILFSLPGTSPNSAENYGQTPIHKAAQHGLMEILGLLHENGAVLDIADHQGLTPIHIASYFQQPKAVQFLLDHGVDANITDNTRRTPLHAAAWRGHVDVVILLLQRGANINSVDDVQRTPLYTAASKGRVHVVKKLLEKGADPGIRTLKTNTPLESARHHGYRQVAKALLRHSKVLNKQDSKEGTTINLGGEDEQLETKVTHSEVLNKQDSRADTTVVLGGDTEQPETKVTHSEVLNKQDSRADTTVVLSGDTEQPETKVTRSLFCCLCS